MQSLSMMRKWRSKTGGVLALACMVASLYALSPRMAHAASGAKPIRVGVIAPEKAPVGQGIMHGAQLAADKINAAGGINGRPIKLFIYDDELSASKAVRDFQRLVQQKKVVAVIGVWTSEAALAVEPWAARLKTPLIIADAGSPRLSERVHKNYAQFKYVFSMLPNSILMAHTVCDFAHHTLVKKLGASSAVIMSENADWTKSLDTAFEKCMPKAGVKIKDHIRFSPSTKDFSPIYSRIESHNPGLILTGLSHTGLQATVQWAHSQVPALMVGMNALAQSQGFWQQSNGAAAGVITLSGPVQGVELTPKTRPYMQAFIKRFGDKVAPGYGVTAFDGLHILARAIERAGTTKGNALVSALEKTDYVGAGSVGHIRFRGRKNRFAHDATYRMNMIQWQNGKRVPVWPLQIARQVKLPGFVQMSKASD